MAVRNFWIEADIDGRATDLEGGPRSKDGGFNLNIWQREHGGKELVLSVSGQIFKEDSTDKLLLKVWDGGGKNVYKKTTVR